MSGVLVWVAVALLGGVGAVARVVGAGEVATRLGRALPVGTFAVNVSGALVLGVLAGAHVAGDAYLLAGTATLGSYTTFSGWMNDSAQLTPGAPRR